MDGLFKDRRQGGFRAQIASRTHVLRSIEFQRQFINTTYGDNPLCALLGITRIGLAFAENKKDERESALGEWNLETFIFYYCSIDIKEICRIVTGKWCR